MSDPGKEEEEMEMKQEEIEQREKNVGLVIEETVIKEPLQTLENPSEVYNFASSKDPEDQVAPEPRRNERGEQLQKNHGHPGPELNQTQGPVPRRGEDEGEAEAQGERDTGEDEEPHGGGEPH